MELPELPLEIQVEIFSHLYDISSSSYPTVLRLSHTHNRILSSRLYRCICIQSHRALESLVATLLSRPDLIEHVRSFFFQGPQGRRRTGRDQLRFLLDEEDDDEGTQEEEASSIFDDDLLTVGLEPGIEGEGQEATWDEHESSMHLCTVILKLCSNHLESIGFVDCVPWFLAPVEGGSLNFPLPYCRDFTGVTVGLFGLLPHLQKKKVDSIEAIETPTTLRRIHLIGGDFGSFALQRVLLGSPTRDTLTHIHITAPTLYRPEHHSHLVTHIVTLLQSLPSLKRISVGFLHWLPAPPLIKGRQKSAASRSRSNSQSGTGDDSFERGQFEGTRLNTGFGPTDSDDRLSQCRRAYAQALPEALQQSKRTDVSVAVIKLPFTEGTPVGFAGWILSHHTLKDRDCCGNAANKAAYRSWIKRDLTVLAPGVALDGAPQSDIWQAQSTIEWSFDGQDHVRATEGDEDVE